MVPINCVSRPYYVCGPSYNQRSGGKVALHVLCHWLNAIGEKAYVIPFGDTRPTITNPYLITPLLSPEISAFFSAEDVDPVFVYPDIVVGNPLNAKCVVHLMLAEPGYFGGTKDFPPQDKVWSFSRAIASMTRSPENILNIPVTDVRAHRPPPAGTVRKGHAFIPTNTTASTATRFFRSPTEPSGSAEREPISSTPCKHLKSATSMRTASLNSRQRYAGARSYSSRRFISIKAGCMVKWAGRACAGRTRKRNGNLLPWLPPNMNPWSFASVRINSRLSSETRSHGNTSVPRVARRQYAAVVTRTARADRRRSENPLRFVG
jgi:hypothetical protein